MVSALDEMRRKAREEGREEGRKTLIRNAVSRLLQTGNSEEKTISLITEFMGISKDEVLN